MAVNAAAAPAGWYPDPSGAAGQRYWDGQEWTAVAPSQPRAVGVVVQGENHVLHFVLTVFTCGLWLPVWLLVEVLAKKNVYTVDDYGRPNLPPRTAVDPALVPKFSDHFTRIAEGEAQTADWVVAGILLVTAAAVLVLIVGSLATG